ncbi:hypothetical protein Bca101_042427 [Brassica carinata]
MEARQKEPETRLERVAKRVARLLQLHDLLLVLGALPLFLGREVVFTIVAFERVASEIFLSVESVHLGAYESNGTRLPKSVKKKMWCLSCFKPSTSEVTFEAEIDLALEVSREEADSQEAKQLASAIEESSRLHKRQEEAEKMRRRELEKDAQIARSFQYDEREMKLDNEEEQPAKTVVESLKDKGKTTVQFDEQVNKDAELALILQESLNMVKPPPPPRRTEERKSIPPRAVLDVEEQLPKAVKKSSKEKGKRKKIEGEQVKKDDELAVILQESLNMVEPPPPPPPRIEERKSIPRRAALDVEKQLSKKAVKKSSKEKGKGKQIEAEQVKKDKELALILQESLNMVEPPRRTKEHKRRARELENDAQIARALQYDERERGLDNNSALEDETYGQPDKIVVESFQDKVKVVKFEEQVKKDEQIAQDLQNRLNKMAFEESPGLHDNAVLDDKDEKLAKIAKSSKEKRKSKQFEEQVNKDEQVAQDLQNLFNKRSLEKSPRLHDNAMLDGKVEQLAKIASSKEKRKRKQFEEQVKNDEQIAQDLQNQLSEIAYKERTGLHDNSVLGNEDEKFPKTVGTSFKLKGKEKILEDEQVKKDEELAARIHESLNMKDEELASRSSLDEEEQRSIWESLKGKGKIKELTEEVEENGKLPEMNPPRIMCGGCNSEIEHGRSVDVLGVLWHPECLWCDACDKPITVQEVANHVSNSRGKFHYACYGRYCYVCKERKMKKYNHHPFWEERYCPAHDSDGTPKCFSCERLEPRGTNYVKLGDRRWQCLECMESAVMDTYEALPLHFEIREFFEGLNMKIEKEFPFLLVEKQALNKAEEEEKIDYQYEVVTRGICLSEAQTVTSVSKRPRMGQHNQLIDMVTETQRVVSDCEVTAILILYGLPRLMTGYILAHEMMHAYLRLNGYRNLNTVIEEGICQVLGHIWLESQTYAPIDATTEAAASSSNNPAATASKKGICSDFEKKLVDFCKNQIETDESPVYGVGFRKVNKMVSNSSLKETLKEIVRRG